MVELLWWLDLLVMVGIFTLLAVSLNLINGYAGMFHLGHHGFWAMGAYAAAWMTNESVLASTGLERGLHAIEFHGSQPLLFVASLLFGGLVAAIGGVLIGIPKSPVGLTTRITISSATSSAGRRRSPGRTPSPSRREWTRCRRSRRRRMP